MSGQRTKSSHRDRDRDYDYDHAHDNGRERDRDRDRNRDKDRERNRDRERYRDEETSSKRQKLQHSSSSVTSHDDKYQKSANSRDRDRDGRPRDGERDREREREKDRDRDRDRDRERHRNRDRDRQNQNDNANNNRRENNGYNPRYECYFGEKCTRDNPQHFKDHSHTHLETLMEQISTASGHQNSGSSSSKSGKIKLPKDFVPKIDKTLLLEQLNLLMSAGFRPPTEAELKRRQDWQNLFNPNPNSSSSVTNYNNDNSPSPPPRRIKRESKKVESEDSKYGKKLYSNPGGDDGSAEEKEKEKKEKEKPNFGLSGKLTEETNTFRGVVIKYSEPPEARKPSRIRWRLYPFKGDETLPTMFIHRQSAYLLGRDRKIADIPIDHPSCSKQHAVIQYRLMPYKRADGSSGRRIKPYIIDLESGNGTLVNGNKIEAKRYVELFEKDVLKFGFSSREYVLLHEHSKDEPEDDEPLGNTPEVDEKVRIKVEQEQD